MSSVTSSSGGPRQSASALPALRRHREIAVAGRPPPLRHQPLENHHIKIVRNDIQPVAVRAGDELWRAGPPGQAERLAKR
jgi:hypothetical protein